MSKYRILSLDGGGLRGLISARILERLSDEPGLSDWIGRTDLFAGTSTGGILALALASGKPASDIFRLYMEKGPEIFDDSVFDDIRDLGKLVGAEYSNKGLKKALRKVFGTTLLRSLPKRVAVTAFDLDNEAADLRERTWAPKIFHNFPGEDSDGEQKAAEVALYTSAAPTYFPSAGGYIDGGVFANNPSMVGLAQAMDSRNRPDERADIEGVVLLSVGTGTSLSYIRGKSVDWGYGQWMKPLINILMDGVAGISDFQCKQILGERYHRVQITFDPEETIPLDSVEKLPRMEEIANAYDITDVRDWLLANWG